MSDDNEILLCWIPSHIGISGNEQVDKAARFALSMVPEKTFKIPFFSFFWSKASEKAEKKKSYYPDCALVTQELHILTCLKRKSNQYAMHVRLHTQ